METSFPEIDGAPSQMEPPAFSTTYHPDPTSLGAAEPTASAHLSPRRTLPLPRSESLAQMGPATVAPEQALVATDRRGGLPQSPAPPPGPVERWWRVLRPRMFWLSLMPILLGTATAWLETPNTKTVFHPFRLLFLALLALLLHAGANLLNEYYDALRGTDGLHAQGSSRMIQRELLSADTVRVVGLLLLALGALILLVLTLVAHAWGVLLLGGASLALAYLYSAPRYALAYFPLSELLVGFVMGPALVISSIQIQGTQVSALAITFALALGALAAAVMLANNLRDLETDRAANKRTLVTYLGAQVGRTLYGALVLLPYLLIALVAFPHSRPHGILLVLLTLPGLFVVITGVLRAETPAALHVVADQTMRLHFRFGFWLLLGYLLSIAAIHLAALAGLH